MGNAAKKDLTQVLKKGVPAKILPRVVTIVPERRAVVEKVNRNSIRLKGDPRTFRFSRELDNGMWLFSSGGDRVIVNPKQFARLRNNSKNRGAGDDKKNGQNEKK